jgi:hypothetical protein
MSDTTVQIINCETGEEVIREMNASELNQYRIDQADFNARKQAATEQEAAKAALLARLGITQEEANLLIGGSN